MNSKNESNVVIDRQRGKMITDGMVTRFYFTMHNLVFDGKLMLSVRGSVVDVGHGFSFTLKTKKEPAIQKGIFALKLISIPMITPFGLSMLL